jgi:signal transduction histidine kinase
MQEDAIARNDSLGLALSYGVQGTAYLVQDVYDEAQRCYKNYIQFFPYAERDGQLTDVYYNYYQCLENAKDYAAIDSLLEDWALLLKDIPPTKDSDLLSTYANWRLKYYRRKFAYLIAKDSLTQATQLLDSLVKYTELSGNVVVEKLNTIDDRCELAMAKGDYISALRYADENLELAIGDMGNRREALMNRSKVYEKLGLYREALADLRASEALKDSVNQARNREQLNRLNKRFALNELQSQNRLLVQRSRFTTGGVAMILSVIALLVFLGLNSRWNRRLQIKNTQLQRERNVVVAQNKQLEIERDHAEAASRAKTAFMQSMTHEIRTPLNAISGFSQVLTMEDIELPDAERMDFCERIQENTRLLTNILDDLILISDFESSSELPPAELCVVAAIVDQAADMIRPVVAKTVTFDCQSTLPAEQTIESYPRLIHIVLSKLLENAAKFTTIGSITLKVSQEDSMLHFAVVDTGPGIPPDKKEYIFERFTKLDSFAQGTGLGLTVGRMIAERLGCTLTLDTDYMNGSKFDFILPIK